MTLDKKVAIITGAGSGIGKATALLFAASGAKVGVLDLSADEIQQTCKEIENAGGKALPLLANVAEASQVENALRQSADHFGRIDIVYANAGINGVQAPIEELTPEDFDKTINTNLRGTFLTIKYAVPYLKKARGGSILVTSSVNGTRVFSNTGATIYSTSKAGQLAMAKMLALELAPFNIRVNVICPGAIDTNISESTEKRDVDKVKIKAKYERDHPLTNHPGSPEEVAQLALFLASDASSHITGTPVWIDGAESLLRG